jgi:transposase InsO family protein
VSAELGVPLARVCPLNGAARSTIYDRRARGEGPTCRPGPKTEVSDEALTETIRQVITECPFAGEGHRKVRGRLRREHQLAVGKNRVLRLMREAGLLAPQRAAKRRRPRLHDGRIITDAPNVRWGTDATMAWTKNDGWVWVFALLDHYSDEAWAHVAKVGNRFAALQPVYDAVIDRFGGLGPDVARGIKLRHD